MGGEGISEYEKHRLARISENKARLEALGLPHLASSVLGSFSKQRPTDLNLKKSKGKRSGQGGGDDEDEEYQPSESDDERVAGDDKEGSCSVSGEDEEGAIISSCSRRKGKSKSSSFTAKVKKKIAYEGLNDTDILDDEVALRQALALSLEASKCCSTGTSASLSQTSTSNVAGNDAQKRRFKGKAQKNVTGKQKTVKQNKARVQLTEDEVVAYFFSFDENGEGYITVRDVKKMVSFHDFSWTDIEIAQMIHCFDNDGDGKLSLEDFKTIVIRCRMLLQGTEGS